ncbi:YisL family protein [Thalassobacillus hwangdonensis]|uniref:UPF0344 protein ACFQ2J_01240 n=1 Tax=Thalassobacillus hwangdonensis TaxID=546108 RepID=A0ABW3KY55_9BACI
MAHLHITSWVLALILLLVVVSLYRSGNAKGAKITQMVLRLDYLLILYSGGSLFASYENIGGLVIVKMLVGLWAIIAMELIGAKYKKQKPASGAWAQLAIAFVAALILGFGFLPLGLLGA